MVTEPPVVAPPVVLPPTVVPPVVELVLDWAYALRERHAAVRVLKSRVGFITCAIRDADKVRV
jgi:hypothetical protein